MINAQKPLAALSLGFFLVLALLAAATSTLGTVYAQPVDNTPPTAKKQQVIQMPDGRPILELAISDLESGIAAIDSISANCDVTITYSQDRKRATVSIRPRDPTKSAEGLFGARDNVGNNTGPQLPIRGGPTPPAAAGGPPGPFTWQK
ncbi:MAG: hypothetical protein FJ316_11505 [SAR202 cluster bacterium]|nr:hypothetical protein [SAR202 cluster bacterium]